MVKRNRNTALVLLAAGLFLLVHRHVGFLNWTALLMIVLGIYRIRVDRGRAGYLLLGAGAVVLISGQLAVVLAVFLISLGIFYMRSHKAHRDREHVSKYRLVESLKRDREPWALQHMSLWHVIGETHLDLTLAIPEEPETVLVVQGGIGDVDLIVPDYLGVAVYASAFFGQIDVNSRKETGVLNRIVWQSPNYETSAQKVRIELSYLIADIDVKVV